MNEPMDSAHKQDSYPVYESTQGNNFDINLPKVRERLVQDAMQAIEVGAPILPAARDIIVEDKPELATKLGLSDSREIPVKRMTKEEHVAWEQNSITSGVSGAARHSGTAGVTIIKKDYDGDLGGDSPRNPLRIGGITHQ